MPRAIPAVTWDRADPSTSSTTTITIIIPNLPPTAPVDRLLRGLRPTRTAASGSRMPTTDEDMSGRFLNEGGGEWLDGLGF